MAKKWYVGKGLVYEASDHNTAQDYAEDNIEQFARDMLTEGTLSGGTISADSPVSWNVVCEPSVIYTDEGKRTEITTNLDIDMEPDADPGAGNEVYVSAFISHAYIQGTAVTDEDGVTVYKDNTDSYTITVTDGAVAALGNAVKPSIPVHSVCLCDVLVTKTIYDRGNIQAGDIDTARQALVTNPFT